MSEKPLRADARRNRDRVLEVANTLFAERGLSVSIEEIAREAGVGIGTVYRHFPTKEALFGAIAVDRVQRLLDQGHELINADDPACAFFDFFESIIEQAMTNKALFTAVADTETFELETISDLGDQLKQVEATLLAHAQQVGAVREDLCLDDLKAITTGCMAMANSLTDHRRVITIITDGLRPRPNEQPSAPA